jgi:hypothetical protein
LRALFVVSMLLSRDPPKMSAERLGVDLREIELE